MMVPCRRKKETQLNRQKKLIDVTNYNSYNGAQTSYSDPNYISGSAIIQSTVQIPFLLLTYLLTYFIQHGDRKNALHVHS